MCLAGGLEVTLKCELMKQPQFWILNDSLKSIDCDCVCHANIAVFNFALGLDMIMDGIMCIMIMSHDS